MASHLDENCVHLLIECETSINGSIISNCCQDRAAFLPNEYEVEAQ